MIYRITHTTTYSYAESVSLCHNLVHLKTRNSPTQTSKSSQLLVTPLPAVSNNRSDFFGNPTTFFTVQEPHKKLSVTAINVAELTATSPPDAQVTPPWETVHEFFQRDHSPQALEAFQFVFDSPFIKADRDLAAYAQPSFAPGRPLIEAALDLTQRIFTDFKYDKTATTLATPVREVLQGRRGVCQDFAHLQIACLRSLGLAARYVSGYLLTAPPAGQSRLVGADASHAWLSVFCPGIGWIDIDPTNNQIPSDKHILLAWGRDYGDVSPIKGVILGGGQHTMSVGVDVAPVTGVQGN